MKRLFTFLLLLAGFAMQAQQPDVYGAWVNGDGDILFMNIDDTFERRSSHGELLAAGVIEYDNKKKLHIKRTDSGEEYYLSYYVGNETLVVNKPSNGKRAWLFRKVRGR